MKYVKYRIVSWEGTHKGIDWLVEPADAPSRMEFILCLPGEFSHAHCTVVQELVDQQGEGRAWRMEILGK